MRVVIDEASEDRSNLRSKERSHREKSHWRVELMSGEQVTDCPSRNSQKSAPRKPIKKARDNHSLDVLCYSRRDNPDNEHSPCDQIYRSPTVEFAKRAEKHGTKCEAQNEHGQAQD